MLRHCAACGTLNAHHLEVCRECGGTLPPAVEPEPEPAEGPDNFTLIAGTCLGLLIAIPLFAIVAVIIGLMLAAIFEGV